MNKLRADVWLCLVIRLCFFFFFFFFSRSLPEPLMTYELHRDFIVPASKYSVGVQRLRFVVDGVHMLNIPT